MAKPKVKGREWYLPLVRLLGDKSTVRVWGKVKNLAQNLQRLIKTLTSVNTFFLDNASNLMASNR